MKNFSLLIAALIFAAVSVGHFYRYMHNVTVMFGDKSIPLDWSLYGGIVAAVLALWMLLAMRGR